MYNTFSYILGVTQTVQKLLSMWGKNTEFIISLLTPLPVSNSNYISKLY